MTKLSAREKLATFFREHLGETLGQEELANVAGITAWQRRIRELRQAGWKIQTNNDDASLKPGEYRLAESPPSDYRFAPKISGRIRAEVLDRNGYTCQMCGVAAGDLDSRGRPIRLHIGHIMAQSLAGETSSANLRALCSRCNEGAKNVTAEPPRLVWLLSQLRRARRDDQRKALDWLKKKFGE